MVQKSFKNDKKTLFIVSTPIGNLEDITFRAINTLKSVSFVFAEDTRVAKKLLNHFEIKKTVYSCHKFNESEATVKIIEKLKDGNDVALITDRGTPIISDPGSISVKKVIEEGFNVVAIPGVTAFVTALVTSGLEVNDFLFYGFLDSKKNTREKELETLKEKNMITILYEAPHRINKTLESILNVLGNRNIVISRELTKINEEIFRGTVKGAIKDYSDIKGEIVIIIDKDNTNNSIDKDVIIKEINDKIKNGESKSYAVKEVCQKYNISKNKVYNDILKEGEV